MLRTTVKIGMLTLVLAQPFALATDPERVDVKPNPTDDKKQFDLDAVKFDPLAFFESLVQRYRTISTYEDATHLVQITRRAGVQDYRQETNLICRIQDDELSIQTPSQQVRASFGLDLPIRKSDAMRQIERRYQFWLAPHLTLRFSDDPLKQLREGIEEGFTPIMAERVMLDNRSMVHLELRSGDGLSEMSEATFDFFINPESMLIERIQSFQRMPDGSDFITTLDIRPTYESEDRASAIAG